MEYADNSESRLTAAFDDVDLLETEHSSSAVGANCVHNLAGVPKDTPCVLKADEAETESAQSKSDTDFVSLALGTDLREDGKDVEAECASLCTVSDNSGGSIATDQNLAVTAEHVCTSSHHSSGLLSEVVNINIP